MPRNEPPNFKDDMYGPYNHEWMFSGGGMLLGVLWMILAWAIPFLLVVALLKYLLSPPRDKGHLESLPEQKTALDILKEAYARNEISRDEYLQKRDDLLEK